MKENKVRAAAEEHMLGLIEKMEEVDPGSDDYLNMSKSLNYQADTCQKVDDRRAKTVDINLLLPTITMIGATALYGILSQTRILDLRPISSLKQLFYLAKR